MSACRVSQTRGATCRFISSRRHGLVGQTALACSRTSRRVAADVASLRLTRGSGRSRGGGRCNRALPSAFPKHHRYVFCWLMPLVAEKVSMQPPFGRRAVSSARSPWAMTSSPYVLARQAGDQGRRVCTPVRAWRGPLPSTQRSSTPGCGWCGLAGARTGGGLGACSKTTCTSRGGMVKWALPGSLP